MRSGVYRLNCNNCHCVYIGQTGRPLLSRIKEHESAWRSRLKFLNNESISDHAKGRSAFADHLVDSGHSFSRDHNVCLLHTKNKCKTLDALEEVEICKHTHNNRIHLVNDIQFYNSFSFIARLCMHTESPI